MAKTKAKELNGVEYKFQSVSPRWYYDINDRYGNTGGGRKNSPDYMDEMFRNVVISPPEVATRGLSYFEDNDDLKGAEDLIGEIERFLREPAKHSGGAKARQAE